MSEYQEALDAILSFRFCDNYGEPQFAFEKEDEVIRTLQELVDKATPLKVSNIGSNVLDGDLQSTGTCPNCKKELYISQDDWYRFIAQYPLDEEVYISCNHCGQALDWGEDE